MAATIALISDSHIGSSVGLCKPGAQTDDGQTFNLSRGQAFLWRSWEDFLARVERITDPVYIVYNGDIGEGDYKDRSAQMMTRNPATITRWMTDIFDPLTTISAGRFVIRGTEAHTGKSAALEEAFADDTGAIPDEDTGASSRYWLNWEIEGVRLDIAHHPKGGGGTPMNSQGVVDRLAANTLFQYANEGRRPPDLVIRSHLHHYLDSRDAFRVRGIITPCWTLKTAHTWRVVDPVVLPDIGGLLIHVSAGNFEVEPVRYKPAPTPYYSIGAK